MELSSKFSLYDMLAMIIPGGVILASIIIVCDYSQTFEKITTYCCGCRSVEFSMDLIQSVIYLVASYVIGLINHWACDGIYKGFRNYPVAIESALIQILRENGNMNLKTIVGSIYDNSKESRPCLFGLIVKTIEAIVCNWVLCRAPKRHDSVVSSYYKAYYALSKENLLGSVPLVENQVALLRNSIIPTIILFCSFYRTMPECCVYIPIILVILIFVIMVQRQQKVYRMIWESANYYKL